MQQRVTLRITAVHNIEHRDFTAVYSNSMRSNYICTVVQFRPTLPQTLFKINACYVSSVAKREKTSGWQILKAYFVFYNLLYVEP